MRLAAMWRIAYADIAGGQAGKKTRVENLSWDCRSRVALPACQLCPLEALQACRLAGLQACKASWPKLSDPSRAWGHGPQVRSGRATRATGGQRVATI